MTQMVYLQLIVPVFFLGVHVLQIHTSKLGSQCCFSVLFLPAVWHPIEQEVESHGPVLQVEYFIVCLVILHLCVTQTLGEIVYVFVCNSHVFFLDILYCFYEVVNFRIHVIVGVNYKLAVVFYFWYGVSRSSQCSTTGVTKVVVCVIMSVWCIK